MAERWLKMDLHCHCNLDPRDHRMCDASPEALIAEAGRLGYQVLAITCHNLDIWSRELAKYAEGQGITLIPGMEVDVEGRRHALLYNFDGSARDLSTLSAIRKRRRKDTLVIAPHPFFPAPSSLGSLVEKNLEVFDAVECSGFFTTRLDFNREARRLALRHRIPMVGNADVHFLWQLGKTFSRVYAEADILSIIEAIKQNRVQVERHALTLAEVCRFWGDALGRILLPQKRVPARTVGRFAPHRP